MPIFQIKNSNLISIKESSFALEKDLQKVTEDNLATVFGLNMVKSEFRLRNFIIDTLAFDNETKSFVIIEHKRDRSFSIIDQGYAYLSSMLNNKADFILEYNEKMRDNLKRDDVDWSQSKVVFLANSFTPYQQNAINFKDLPIELWEVKKYINETIIYSQLKPAETRESIKTISKNKVISKVSREVKKYSVEDHFKKGWDKSREIFDELRGRIMEVDDRLEEVAVKFYIGYKIGNSILVNLSIRKSKIVLGLFRVRPNDLNDPEKLATYRKKSMEYYNKHESQFIVNDKKDIDYATFLIKQVYEKFYM